MARRWQDASSSGSPWCPPRHTGPTVWITCRTESRPAPVIFASPVSQPPSDRHSSSSSGPAARWIAPSTPPPPSRLELAALTIASASASVVMSPWCSVIRAMRGRLGDEDGVDRRGSVRQRHGDAVVAVADRVLVADGDDGDRREDRAAVLGQPHARPPRPRGGDGPEGAVELGGAVGLHRAGDRAQRDLPDAAADAGAPARVVDGEAAVLRLAPEAAPQRRPPARPGHVVERLLGVDRG